MGVGICVSGFVPCSDAELALPHSGLRGGQHALRLQHLCFTLLHCSLPVCDVIFLPLRAAGFHQLCLFVEGPAML